MESRVGSVGVNLQQCRPVCVHVCVHVTVLAGNGHKLKSLSERAGGGGGGGVGDGQRDDKEEGEEMGSFP